MGRFRPGDAVVIVDNPEWGGLDRYLLTGRKGLVIEEMPGSQNDAGPFYRVDVDASEPPLADRGSAKLGEALGKYRGGVVVHERFLAPAQEGGDPVSGPAPIEVLND